MAIENRDLAAGTKLIAKYKKEEFKAEVVAGEDGKVKYRLADGWEFKSPSAAGTAITGKACNGWAFWSLEPDGAPAEPPEPEGSQDQGETAEDAETPDQPPSAGFRRVPNQKGVGEGEVRLYCDTCKTSFTITADQQPETCPEGHYPGEASEA